MGKFTLTTIRAVLGSIFILSGLAKSFDADYFGNIMASYGIEWLYALAPIVIFTEMLLGLALIFDIYTKYMAAAVMVLVLIFSAVYTYGNIVVGIKDCGCFGRATAANSLLTMVYLRNIFLFIGAAWIFKKTSVVEVSISASTVCASLFLVFAGAFMCGNTFKWHVKRTGIAEFKSVALSQHPLRQFVKTSPDSTYMVTVFSYTCPHCMNSIDNIEQYQKFGIVDRVIGIGVDNPAAEAAFSKVFTPSFSIKNYSIDKISKLSVDFPITYFVKQDSIVGIMTGEVPSAYLFLNGQFESR